MASEKRDCLRILIDKAPFITFRMGHHFPHPSSIQPRVPWFFLGFPTERACHCFWTKELDFCNLFATNKNAGLEATHGNDLHIANPQGRYRGIISILAEAMRYAQDLSSEPVDLCLNILSYDLNMLTMMFPKVGDDFKGFSYYTAVSGLTMANKVLGRLYGRPGTWLLHGKTHPTKIGDRYYMQRIARA